MTAVIVLLLAGHSTHPSPLPAAPFNPSPPPPLRTALLDQAVPTRAYCACRKSTIASRAPLAQWLERWSYEP